MPALHGGPVVEAAVLFVLAAAPLAGALIVGRYVVVSWLREHRTDAMLGAGIACVLGFYGVVASAMLLEVWWR